MTGMGARCSEYTHFSLAGLILLALAESVLGLNPINLPFSL